MLVSRLGAKAVYACDPLESLRDECAARHPGVVVKLGRAESIPFEADSVDHAMAQLVLHFVSESPDAASEKAEEVSLRCGLAVAAHPSAEDIRALTSPVGRTASPRRRASG